MKRVTIAIHPQDLRHAMKSLAARDEHIRARLSRDPVLRKAALREAAHCRRIADLIGALLGGIG